MNETKAKCNNCWEHRDCPSNVKSKCQAYQTDSGNECWFLAKEFCPSLKDNFNNCWECPWFKKMNPNFDKTLV